MNPTERASHPSRAQIEALLDFLDKNPSLAKGFSKVPSARDASRKMWERLSLELNSLGGCVKSWKQWTKYWADKKSAVKKKGALRFRTKNKTGGGSEVVELSVVEERILALMGGEGFATGDRHLEINPFEDTQYITFDPVPSSIEDNTDSPSLLANVLPSSIQQQHSTPPSCPNQSQPYPDVIDTGIPIIETPQRPSQHDVECIPGTSYLSSRPSVVHIVSQSPLPRAQAPSTPPRVSAPASPPTPSGSGRHPQQRSLNVHRQLTGSPIRPHPNDTTSNRRTRRRRQLSPPSQRQSHLSGFAERFLRLEEQRSELLQSYLDSEVLRQQSAAQALQAIGDGLKMLAEALKK